MINKTAHFLCHPFSQTMTLTLLIKSFCQTERLANKWQMLIQLAHLLPILSAEYKTAETEVSGCKN